MAKLIENIRKLSLSVDKRPFPCNNTYTCYKNVLHYFSLLVFFVEFVMFRLLRLVTFRCYALNCFSYPLVFLYQYGNVNSLWNSRTPLRHTLALYSAPVLSPWMEPCPLKNLFLEN